MSAPTATEVFEAVTEMADYGMAYWAESTETDGSTYTVTYEDPEGDDMVTKTVTQADINRAARRLASGEVPIRDDIREWIKQGIREDVGMFDAWCGDCIVQVALFGEVLMG